MRHKYKGPTVLGREIEPGDVIMNEWTGKLMEVFCVLLKDGERVKLECRRLEDQKVEILEGNWESTTRLIIRETAAINDDPLPIQIKRFSTSLPKN